MLEKQLHWHYVNDQIFQYISIADEGIKGYKGM